MNSFEKDFKEKCENYLKERYSNEFTFMFLSKSVSFGNLYYEYLLIHHISDECTPIHNVSFCSNGYVRSSRMFIDHDTTKVVKRDF